MGAMILQLDWPTVAKQLHTLHWPIIAAAALLYPAALLLNAAKWWTALRLHDLRFRFNHLLRAGCVGVFLNNLLPTAIGGDIYRVYRTSNAGSTSQAVSAVLLERVVGLAVMLLNGLVGAVWLMNSSALARVYVVWAVGGFVIAGAVLILCTCFHAQLGSALLSRHLQPVVANLRRIARPHRAWPSLIIYSVAFQL